MARFLDPKLLFLIDRSLILPNDPQPGLLLVSSCPPDYDAASPEAVLCQLHVRKEAVDPNTRIFYKVRLNTKLIA